MIDLKQGHSLTQFEPLTWRKVDWNADGDQVSSSTMVSCPSGHIASLNDHEIAPTGEVSPSLECPTEDCNWHEHVKLVGWVE